MMDGTKATEAAVKAGTRDTSEDLLTACHLRAAIQPDAFVGAEAKLPSEAWNERAQIALIVARDGFAVLRGIATDEEIGCIRDAVEPLLRRSDVIKRELGERGGSPQIVEIERVTDLCPELSSCGFFAKAQAISAYILKAPVKLQYDHLIFKPPLNMKETAWHQDAAYGRRITFSSRRVHWWLPLHDVSEDRSCMHFVPNSHRMPVYKHFPVAPSSDALRTNLPAGAKVVVCPLNQGDATIHLPTTLHFTGPNRTDRSRTALIVQFTARTWLPRLTR